jgi:hypothetical protein
MQQSQNRRPAEAPEEYEPLVPPAVLDPTPPEDYEEFLAFQQVGFRNMREQLAKRRKKK